MVGRALIDEDIDAAELARRLGWKPQRLNNYMRGQRRPGIRELGEIAECLTSLQLMSLIEVVSEGAVSDAADVIEMLETNLTLNEMRGLVDALHDRYFPDELPAAAEGGEATGARAAPRRKPSPEVEE